MLKPVGIQRLAQQQQELLTIAAKMLRKDGTLVYSTCSIEPTENEKQLEVFVQNNPSFKLQEQKTTLPYRIQGDWRGSQKPDINGWPSNRDGGYTGRLTKGQADWSE